MKTVWAQHREIYLRRTTHCNNMCNKKSNTKPLPTLLTNVPSSWHMSNFYCSNVDPALINPPAVQLGVRFKQLLTDIYIYIMYRLWKKLFLRYHRAKPGFWAASDSFQPCHSNSSRSRDPYDLRVATEWPRETCFATSWCSNTAILKRMVTSAEFTEEFCRDEKKNTKNTSWLANLVDNVKINWSRCFIKIYYYFKRPATKK